jgi:hypothetical protein
VPFNPDGDAEKTQRFILVQTDRALRPMRLGLSCTRMLVVEVTSGSRERECVLGLDLMWRMRLSSYL